MTQDPNSFDQEIKDAQANPQAQTQGTEGDQTPIKTTPEGEQSVDYQKKFAASSSEALRLLEENKKKDELIAQLSAKATENQPMDTMYPGFDQLDSEAQKNLIAYTNLITKRTKDEIYKDPAISHAKTMYVASKWDSAFGTVAAKYPELNKSKDEFKSKYFNPNNIPDNIENILTDLAKAHLFDKATEIGAEEERAKQKRVDLERSTGGDKTPQASRSLEDWARMARENPAKFAQNSKQYQQDLDAGKLQE